MLRKLGLYLKWNIDAAEKIILVAGASRLGNLLEEASKSFYSTHFVQFADGIQNRIFVVVIPINSKKFIIKCTIDYHYYTKHMKEQTLGIQLQTL